MSSRRPIIAFAATVVLSACGASAPPAKELADEMVNTMVERGDITEAVGACMRQEVADFSLTEEQATGFNDLDDVAKKADGGNELAKQIIEDFQAALASCN